MAFNFMAALGGAAARGSKIIQAKREQKVSDEKTAQQRQWIVESEQRQYATAKKERRDIKSERAEELISTMVALGLPLEAAKGVAKGGVGAAEDAITNLKTARTNGIDASSFYTMNTPVTAGEITEVSKGPSLVIDSPAIKNMYGNLNSNVNNHNEMLLKLSNKQLQLDLQTPQGIAEYDKIEIKKTQYLKDIGSIANAKDTSGTEGRLFGESTVRANIDAARSRALSTYEMTLNIEDQVITGLQGKGVEVNVADLQATQFLRSSLKDSKLKDAFMNSSIVALETQAIANIKNLGLQKIRDDISLVKEFPDGLTSETDRTLDIGAVIRVPIKDSSGSLTGTYTYSIYTGTKDKNNYVPLYTGA